jgi:hypothetical protein
VSTGCWYSQGLGSAKLACTGVVKLSMPMRCWLPHSTSTVLSGGGVGQLHLNMSTTTTVA